MNLICVALALSPLPQDIALVGASVLDVVEGVARPDQAVRLRGERILWVGPRAELEPGAEIVELEGGYLVPGLFDMHVHGVGSDAALEAMVTRGITSARSMGEPLEDARRRMEEREAPDWRGPRLFLCGPVLAGAPDHAGHVPTTSEEEIEAAFAVFDLDGFDFVKVHNYVAPDLLGRLVDEIDERGLIWSGHLPPGVDLLDWMAHGPRSLEHANVLAERGLSRASMASDEALSKDLVRWEQERGPAMVEGMREHGVTLVPTLIAHQRFVELVRGEVSLEGDPRAQDLPPGRREEWTAYGPDMFPENFAHQRDTVQEGARHIVGFLHAQGIPILAGSDCGAPYVFPGDGLHDELAELLASGLTPAEVLRCATDGPARFLEVEAGRVEAGLFADLLWVRTDPLQDLGTLRTPERVWIRGR